MTSLSLLLNIATYFTKHVILWN